ncbi:MAG: universal stress protein [Rhodospirillales bacterium]|nr:MAG: universal stress protein [Rhodospirillales bacterium]
MKTILLPFHDEAAGRVALDTACRVAKRFGSYVEGLLVREHPHVDIVPGMPVSAAYLSEAAKEWRSFADASRGHFLQYLEERGVPYGELEVEADGATAAWRELEGRESGTVGTYGRLFDLIVLGRVTSEATERWQATCEAAMFESGRPVLLAPPEPPEVIGRKILVAWNGSTETARTVALTMPFLTAAEEVLVLGVEGWIPGGPAGTELAHHLVRNGVNASYDLVKPSGVSAGEAILEECARTGCDLLVKGAYTRTRFTQVMFGGATLHVMQNATLPVVMAH